MASLTLKTLAELVGGSLTGDPDLVITGVSGLREAQLGQISFLANERYLPLLEQTQASAVVVPECFEAKACPAATIRVEDPSLAFARLVHEFAPPPVELEPGVHPTAVLGRDVTLGRDVRIGAATVVQDGARIGDGTVLHPQVYVGHQTTIGAECVFHPGVKVHERVRIGDRVILHAGTVIGSDGFGYAQVNSVHEKIPQVGSVEIGDDVEIGANCTVDRARFGATVIGRGTKIDNLVHLAHNVQLGERCLIVAGTAIAGSTQLEDDVTVAGQAGIDGHLTIGHHTTILAKAGVLKNVPPHSVVSGFPARPRERVQREWAAVRRLPDLLERVRQLEQKVTELEKTTEDDRSSG